MPILNSLFRKLKPAIKGSLFFLFLMLNNISGISQSELANNWEAELSKVEGQERIDLILKLSDDIAKNDISLADSLAKEGIALARQLGDSLGMYRIKTNLGKIYNKKGQLDTGIEVIQRSLMYFERDETLDFDKAKAQLSLALLYTDKRNFEKADSLISESESYFLKPDQLFWKSRILHARGCLFFGKDNDETAFNYFTEALKISKQLNNVEYTGNILEKMALIKTRQGHYTEALELQFQVISTDCSLLTKANSYYGMGQTYSSLNDFKQTAKYLELSLKLYQKAGYECNASNSIYAMGVMERKQLNYGEALKYYEQCLKIQKKCKLYIGATLGAIGNVYNNLGQPDKANKYYDEQLELAKARNNWSGIYHVYYNRGHFALYKSKRYNDALKYALVSYQMAVEKGRLLHLWQSNNLLTNVYYELGNHEKEDFHEEQFYLYDDSIKNYEKIKKIGALEQKHFSQLQKDSLSSINQNKIDETTGFFDNSNILIGLGLLLLFFTMSFFFLKNSRNKATEHLEISPLEQTKMDQYFEELFDRLDQNKVTSDVEKSQSINTEIIPIHNMTEFLSNNISTSKDWTSFEHYFEKVHKDFFKNLKATYPTISANELNICALIKLNLRNKDIAQVMGISPESVRKALNRLSKKMEIPTDETLREFILKL